MKNQLIFNVVLVLKAGNWLCSNQLYLVIQNKANYFDSYEGKAGNILKSFIWQKPVSDQQVPLERPDFALARFAKFRSSL